MAKFKDETIAKMLKRYAELKKEYEAMDIEDLKKIMSISNGNRKIGKVLNVSLMPIVTCSNCNECRHFCYDIKACCGPHWENVIRARIKNTVLLQRDMKAYFDRIDGKLTRRRKNKFFRWHVAGDIVNAEYFENMVALAVKHPDFIFWTYTKNYKLVNQYVKEHGGDRVKAIPANLHIMFSEWDGLKLDNPYNFPFFTCRLKDGNKNHAYHWFEKFFRCPGNCDVCKRENRGCLIGENTWIDEH